MHYDTPRTTTAYNLSDTSDDVLAPRHRHELVTGSGIAPQLVAERGYRTVSDPAELRRLGFADYQCRPGLLIPLHNTTGGNGRFALKPDRPRVEQRPGKPDRVIKYEGQAAQPLILDIPRRCLSSLLDATVDLWITEGWKKGDALAGSGKCAIALSGVYGWCHRDAQGHSGVPLPDWDPILPTLDGRRVFIVFDSDAASNPNVGLAERRLVNFLRSHGAWATIVRLPSGPSSEKVGVDDFLVAQGATALDDLAAAAELASSDDVQALRARVRQLEQLLSAQAAVLRNRGLTADEGLPPLSRKARSTGYLPRTRGPIPLRSTALLDSPRSPTGDASFARKTHPPRDDGALLATPR